jgi:hypothetical protein
VTIIVAIVAAAFGGYAVSLANERTITQSTTILNTVTKSTRQTITYVQIVPMTVSPSVGTITEQILTKYTVYYTVYVFGNCTVEPATINLQSPTTTTNYIFPSKNTTSGTVYFTVTTTQTATTSTSATTIDSTLSPQTIYIQSGTVTTTSIQTCPVYS